MGLNQRISSAPVTPPTGVVVPEAGGSATLIQHPLPEKIPSRLHLPVTNPTYLLKKGTLSLKSEGKDNSQDIDVDGMIILK